MKGTKGTTFWLPEPLDKIVENIQKLRDDPKKTQTIKFLIYKAMTDLGFLSPEQMKALGTQTVTDFEIVYRQQVSPVMTKIMKGWLVYESEFYKDAFGLHPEDLPMFAGLPPQKQKSRLTFQNLSKEIQFAFYRWCYTKRILYNSIAQCRNCHKFHPTQLDADNCATMDAMAATQEKNNQIKKAII